jgi:rhodanese-related sulfurtransferase
MPNKSKKKMPCRSCKPSPKNKLFNDEIYQSRVKSSEYKDIKNYLPKLENGKCKMTTAKNSNKNLKLNLGVKHAKKLVFYFAAEEKPIRECAKINHPDQAYGKYTNAGVVRVDAKGMSTLPYRCPQAYREHGLTYVPHVHLVLSDARCNKWAEGIYTHQVFCPIDKREVEATRKAGCALIVNALPFEYFVKCHIPGSVPLPYTSFPGKLTEKDVDSYLKKSLAHVPKLQQAVMKRKLNLKDVPLIIYCYKSTCDASHKLEKVLRDMGYTNMKHYKGGILDYFKK